MSLLKNKIFILSVVVVLLLLVVTAAFKLFSIYAFNSFSKDLETGNQQLFTGFKDEISTADKINLNLFKASESLSNSSSFSKEKNAQYLSQTKTEYDNSLTAYKKGLDDLVTNVSKLESFSKMPLWLGGNQKKFVADLTASLKSYKAARKTDYDSMVKAEPVFNNSLQVIGDTSVLLGYALALQNAQSEQEVVTALAQNFSQLAPLEKYTKADYKFEGQDTLAKEYPDSYKAFAAFKTIFGQYYTAFKALTQGDTSQAANLNQIGREFENSISALQNPFREIAAEAKPNTTKIKDAYANYTKALDFYSEKKLYSNLLSESKCLVQNNQNKAVVLAYAVQLYETDKEKPPADKSFSALVGTLKTGNYFDSSLKYNESDFTYASDGVMYFEIGYKDEVSDKMETFIIGIKEGTTSQSLGLSTQVFKLKGVEVDLGSVNLLVNYIKSLTR